MKTNQIKAGAILNYVQLFVGVIISLSIHQTIINKIGISENGILNMATNAISYLNLLNLGLGSAFIRFNMKYRVAGDLEGEQKLNGLFLVFYLIIAVLMAICGTGIILGADSIFVEFTSSEIVTLKKVMSIILIQSCMNLLGSVFTMNINSRERFIFAKSVSILNTILLPLGKLAVVLNGYKAIGIALVTCAFSFAVIIIEGFYAIFRLKIRFKFGKIEKGLIKSIFAFSFFIFLNQIIDMINWQIDTLVLGVVSGTAAVAVYSIASGLNSYVLTFSTAISSVLVPRVNMLVASNASKEEINGLFVKTGRIQFAILGLVMLGYIFFGKAFIVNFFANEEYVNAYYIGLIIILPLIVPLIQNVGIEIQRAYNKHKFRSIAYTIMALVNLGMSIPLGIYYGAIGCAIGTCVSLLLGNGLIMNIYYHKKIGINIIAFWKSILRFVPALIIPISVGVVMMLYVDLSNVWWFLLSIAGFSVIYCISMYLFGLNSDERDKINNKFSKLKKKKARVDVNDGE